VPLDSSLASYILARTGLVFPESRRGALKDGVARAMVRARIRDVGEYLRRLDDPLLMDDLIAEITVGETYFFRDPDQVAMLREQVLPELVGLVRNRPLRVWSAGCATGEEPYTLAMLLADLEPARGNRILGTDISRNALKQARAARYRAWSLRNTPADLRARFFHEMDGEFGLTRAIRERVEFRYLNLAEDLYPAPGSVWGMDLILCRNVLIYFDPPTAERVTRGLLDSLTPDGWLLLGAADPVIPDSVPCQVVVTGAGLAYRRETAETGMRGRRRPHGGPSVPRSAPGAAPIASPASPSAPGRGPTSGRSEHDPVAAGPPAAARPVGPADAARRAYGEGRYGEAADHATTWVVTDPSAEAWTVLVRALANLGRLEEASHACAAALEAHGGAAELHYLHAVLLGEGGLPGESAGAARRALYLDRHHVAAHLALGNALARVGDATAAARSFRNAADELGRLDADAVVSGERAGRLAAVARARLQLLEVKP